MLLHLSSSAPNAAASLRLAKRGSSRARLALVRNSDEVALMLFSVLAVHAPRTTSSSSANRSESVIYIEIGVGARAWMRPEEERVSSEIGCRPFNYARLREVQYRIGAI